MSNIQLVDNIKNLCYKNNISVSQLEKTLNLSPGLISRWSKNTPSLDRLIDIARFFNVTIDELIGENTKSSTNNKEISYFIRLLYQETQNLKIQWRILDIYEPPIYFNDLTKKILNTGKNDYYYILYNEGCFIIGISYDEDNNISNHLSLYILPDSNSIPELVCSDFNKLTQLFELVSNNLKKQLNHMKATKLINSFINDVQTNDMNDPSFNDNEKSTMMQFG